MKMRITILALTLLRIAAMADPNEDEEKFLLVPGDHKFYPGTDETTFKRSELPKPVLSLLDQLDWGKADGSEPDSYVGYAIDLNNDEKMEYFIETIRGGSGGPAFVVLAEMKGRWTTITDFQGGFYIIPVANSWPHLVVISRGGGGNYSKDRFEFESGSYRMTVAEHYDRGKITKKNIPKNTKG